ncbi:MAG: hypothetical protein ACRETM_13295 [Stenotrophobium sp.]
MDTKIIVEMAMQVIERLARLSPTVCVVVVCVMALAVAYKALGVAEKSLQKGKD